MTDQYQIQEYTQTAAALAILREKYSGPFDVITTKGMSVAKEARAEVKGYRVALEKLRVELKAPALERTRLIDAEAKRITKELLEIEEPIDQQIKEEERRKEEEKAEKARAEAARLAGIAAKISAIRNQVSLVAHQPATVIKAELEKALALELSADEFQEFMPDAIEALAETRKNLQAALDARLLHEAEQARIQAEREELAKLREAEAIRKAEEARIEAKAKAKADAEAAEIRQKQEAEQARIQAAQQELDERQRKIEEAEAEAEAIAKAKAKAKAEAEAKAKAVKPLRKGKAIDPIADIKQALNANPETVKALDEAYQRGYQAGLNSAQQAA
jgi:hypothetical protein